MAVQVSDAQIKLAQDGDLDPLLKLLRHDDESVRGLAAKAVGNLIYQDNEVVLKGAAGYAPLLEMVKHQDDEVRSKAVWTVAILASNDENQTEVIKQIGWDVIMSLIKDTVVEVQCGGVTLLGNLALLRDNKIQIINKGGVDVLMVLLKETRDVIVKRAIVTALSNIVDSDNAIEVIDDEGLDLLLSLMEKTDDERLLSGIVHTISNIANSDNKKLNKKITKQALDRLIVLLRSPADVIQKGTVMVFNGLSASRTFQASLFEKGAVKQMLEMLQDSDDEELILGLILCINNLSQNDENHNELLEFGVQEALLVLHDKTNNSDIKRECAEALDSLSGPVRSSSSRSRRRSSRASPLRADGTGVKDNVKQIIKMLIKDPSLQRKLQKMGVIPQLIALLRKEQPDELKGHALDALTMLAMNNSFNQQNIALSNDGNGIRYVEDIIRDPYVKPQLLLRAVRLLGTLCWNNKIVQDVVDENNIARLVFLLESFDNGLKKASVTAVACISEGNDKNQQILHKHRADKIVSQIVMLEREPNSLVAAGAHAIASLCRGNPKSQIICSRALGSLVMHLESAVQNTQEGEEDHVVQEHLTDALFELSRNNKENKGILWRMHIVRLLIEILSNADASPVTHYNSLGILWEYSKNDNKGKLLAGNKHLTRLLDPLCESDDTFVKDAASRLRAKFGLE